MKKDSNICSDQIYEEGFKYLLRSNMKKDSNICEIWRGIQIFAQVPRQQCDPVTRQVCEQVAKEVRLIFRSFTFHVSLSLFTFTFTFQVAKEVRSCVMRAIHFSDFCKLWIKLSIATTNSINAGHTSHLSHARLADLSTSPLVLVLIFNACYLNGKWLHLYGKPTWSKTPGDDPEISPSPRAIWDQNQFLKIILRRKIKKIKAARCSTLFLAGL